MIYPVDEFETITPELQLSAAKLAAAAYFDNPAHIFMCPNIETRFQHLEFILKANLSMQLKHGAQSFCYTEDGGVKAMGYWTTPNSGKINTFTKIKAGLLKIPFIMGWQGFRRVLVASSEIDLHLKKAFGTSQNYLFLNNFVMEESRRSKGWGSQILQHQFELISKSKKEQLLALTTQRYWTVEFYRRHGFEVVLEGKIGSGPLAFTNWTMKKIL